MLKIFDKYNPRANPANTNYPNGSIKDRSVEGALDGTPLSSDWGNDMLGFSEALLADAGVTPSGNPDTAVASDRMTAFRIAAMRVETAVSYTGGDTSLVGLVRAGAIAQEFEYVVHGPSLTRWKIGTVTGTFAGDFNPTTGIDSGLTGALVQVDQITNSPLLIKTDSMKVMFDLTGSVLTLNQDVVIKGVRVLSGAVVTLPTLVNASDYKILLLSDGSLSAQLYDAANPAGSVMVGGFHVYHTTGGINPRSLWDENWKPSAKSPRSMVLSPDQRVWADIYFMDVEYALNNYSRPDVTIADGSSPPIVPAIYGGNGVSTYGSLTWFEAWDLVINAGKRLVFWGEFSGLAYGVVEQQSVGTDPVTTKYQAGHRSAIGLEQATGVLWTWGADTQGSSGAAAAITDGRGSVYSGDPSSVLLGAYWSIGVGSGSRSASWGNSPSFSLDSISVRAVCDHLIL